MWGIGCHLLVSFLALSVWPFGHRKDAWSAHCHALIVCHWCTSCIFICLLVNKHWRNWPSFKHLGQRTKWKPSSFIPFHRGPQSKAADLPLCYFKKFCIVEFPVVSADSWSVLAFIPRCHSSVLKARFSVWALGGLTSVRESSIWHKTFVFPNGMTSFEGPYTSMLHSPFHSLLPKSHCSAFMA